jgi:hypothetical protein
VPVDIPYLVSSRGVLPPLSQTRLASCNTQFELQYSCASEMPAAYTTSRASPAVVMGGAGDDNRAHDLLVVGEYAKDCLEDANEVQVTELANLVDTTENASKTMFPWKSVPAEGSFERYAGVMNQFPGITTAVPSLQGMLTYINDLIRSKLESGEALHEAFQQELQNMQGELQAFTRGPLSAWWAALAAESPVSEQDMLALTQAMYDGMQQLLDKTGIPSEPLREDQLLARLGQGEAWYRVEGRLSTLYHKLKWWAQGAVVVGAFSAVTWASTWFLTGVNVHADWTFYYNAAAEYTPDSFRWLGPFGKFLFEPPTLVSATARAATIGTNLLSFVTGAPGEAAKTSSSGLVWALRKQLLASTNLNKALASISGVILGSESVVSRLPHDLAERVSATVGRVYGHKATVVKGLMLLSSYSSGGVAACATTASLMGTWYAVSLVMGKFYTFVSSQVTQRRRGQTVSRIQEGEQNRRQLKYFKCNPKNGTCTSGKTVTRTLQKYQYATDDECRLRCGQAFARVKRQAKVADRRATAVTDDDIPELSAEDLEQLQEAMGLSGGSSRFLKGYGGGGSRYFGAVYLL